MTIDFGFWKRHTHVHTGNLLALLAVGIAQITVLHLLIGHASQSQTGLLARGITLLVLPFMAIFFASRMAAYTTNRLQLDLLTSLSGASTNDIEQLHAHTFSKAATIDVDHLYQFWRDLFVTVCVNFPVLLYLVFLLGINRSFSILVGLGALIVILMTLSYAINARIKAKHRKHHNVYEELQNRISDYVSNVFQFRLYRREKTYVQSLSRQLTQFSILTAKLSQNRQLNTTFVSSVMLLFLWGGLSLLQHEKPIAPTDLAIVTLVFLEIRRIGTELFASVNSCQRAHESAIILNQWLARPISNEKPETILLPVVPISVENLKFQYRTSATQINYPDLTISVGEKVWIKGPNGRGKSTLWKILTGLYTSMTPSIRLNNTLRVGDGRMTFWKNISVVTEPAHCYSGRLWEIIGNFSAQREDIIHWLSIQQLLPFFDTYPVQVDTYYDSAVNNLSAGQLKWLILMQAFYLIPDFLVLDEPFSSLDESRQQRTLQLINQLPASTTLLIISHHNLPISFDKTVTL